MSERLLPCAHCGGAPALMEYSLSSMVHCPTCGVSAPWQHGGGDHVQRAVAAWNRRVPAQGQDATMKSEHLWPLVEQFATTDTDNDERVPASAGVPVEVREALRVAIQLAEIASDWNLSEVEIDGEMVRTWDIRNQLKSALDAQEQGVDNE